MGWQPRPQSQNNDLAVVGICCAISSLVLLIAAPFTVGFSMLLSGPLGIGGLVCGLIARQQADRGEAGARGTAQAAFVTGIVSIVLHVIVVVVGVVLLVFLVDALNGLDFSPPDQDPELKPDPALLLSRLR